MFLLKRVYDKASPEDGVRFLVERLWPRGIGKTGLRLDAWLKDVAPSDALRRWFSHDPQKWSLVYSSHDTEHNNAVALTEYLNARMGKKRRYNHA